VLQAAEAVAAAGDKPTDEPVLDQLAIDMVELRAAVRARRAAS
jgi:hypothetical protein